ncbi:HAD family hydrolase [Flavihumibacter rivuli]|uniref:HAD family hydrolase n=1 Tax=Flavihumibacter rivuli TaxID=2838156 RepID=UPI001BDEE95B|nr:HAD family hydrolase [Flavihumibacter rivuli]ULQ55701.1 HAD family hydrolase [Flavihumibacter rivuli]
MFLLATDLDGTFLAGTNAQREELYQWIRSTVDIRLAYVTGRSLDAVSPLLIDPFLPKPDYIIADVGATIVAGETLQPVQPIHAEIEARWPGAELVENMLMGVEGLSKQEVPMNRRSSYYYEKGHQPNQVYGRLSSLGCEAIYSAGKYLDVLPAGINKGYTLKRLAAVLGIPNHRIMACGDTMNDLSMLDAGYQSVVVGNAEPGLKALLDKKETVYFADEPGCGGILEGLDYFSWR